MRMCVFVNRWFNHLGVLEHAQVSVHAQGSGFVASAFVKLGCLVEFPLVGIDVCQEQLIVVLTPLLPLLQISQQKHWHACRDKYSRACTHTRTQQLCMCACVHTMNKASQKVLKTIGLLDAISLRFEPTLNSYTISHNRTNTVFIEHDEHFFHITERKHTLKGGHFPFSKGRTAETFSGPSWKRLSSATACILSRNVCTLNIFAYMRVCRLDSGQRFLPCLRVFTCSPVQSLAIKCMNTIIIVIGPVSPKPCQTLMMSALVRAEISKLGFTQYWSIFSPYWRVGITSMLFMSSR